MYPNSADAKFDMEYYCNKHLIMVDELLGDALQGRTVDAGIAGGAPGQPPAFITMGHLMFESLEIFQQSFAPHAEKMMADIPNFTNIQPQIQISEIKL